jgi:hypothetical protein
MCTMKTASLNVHLCLLRFLCVPNFEMLPRVLVQRSLYGGGGGGGKVIPVTASFGCGWMVWG